MQSCPVGAELFMTCSSILLDWGEEYSKVELQNITFFHLIFFFKVQRSIVSPLAIAAMNNTLIHWGSISLGDILHLCGLLRLFLFSPPICRLKMDPFFYGFLYRNCLKTKKGSFGWVCFETNYNNMKNTQYRMKLKTIWSGPKIIMHFKRPVIKVEFYLSSKVFSFVCLDSHYLQNLKLLLMRREWCEVPLKKS